MTQSTFAVRAIGHSLPEALVKVLLEKHPTAFGYASPQKDASIHTDPFVADEHDLASALAEIEKEYKHDAVYYWFTENPEMNYESLQPFMGKTENNKEGEIVKTLVSVIIEGEFPKYHGKDQAGEGFTPEYFVMQEVVQPKIDELWDLSGGDLKLFMTMWGKKTTQDYLQECLGPRASILVIPAAGDSKGTSNAKDAMSRPWGFCSRPLTYAAQENEIVKETKEEKPLTMKQKAELKAAGKTAELEKEPAPDAGKVIKPEELYAPLMKKDNKFFMNGTTLWVRPRGGADTKEAKEFWNRHSTLNRPMDGDKIDPKKLYAGFPADKLRANSPLYELMVSMTTKEPKKAGSEQGPAVPDKTVVEPIDNLPAGLLIPADIKNAYLNQKKAGKYAMTDLDTLKAKLSEYPLASVQLGETSGDLLMLSPEAYNKIPGPITKAMLHEFRCIILEMRGQLELEEPKVKPEEKPVEQPVTGKPLTMKEKAELKRKAA